MDISPKMIRLYTVPLENILSVIEMFLQQRPLSCLPGQS